jgi:hypothetical protein
LTVDGQKSGLLPFLSTPTDNGQPEDHPTR